MKSKEEKKKNILETFEKINKDHKAAHWNLLYQISLQVTGFVEKYRFRESTKNTLSSQGDD